MKTTTLIGSSVALAMLTMTTNAQGTNDCGSAQPIAGVGMFPFDNIGATTDGPADCNGQPVRRDVWFDWTPSSTGGFRLRTCGQTALDTRVAVYEGIGCPPTMQLECAAGGCLEQTDLSFLATSGAHYLIRVGSRAVGEDGNGTFSIVDNPCLTNPDDGMEENDTCNTAVTISDAAFPNLYVTKTDPDWYTFGIADGATLTATFTGAGGAATNGDLDVYLFSDCAGTQVASSTTPTSMEQIMYTNNTGSCQTYYMRAEIWNGSTDDCNSYSMNISGTSVCASSCTSYCNSLPNATGMAALLSCTGSPNSSLALTSTPVPNTTGQFFYGPMMLGGGSSLGDGLRCVGGASTRILPFVNAGMMAQLPNTATITVNYTAPYAAGLTGTQYFQHWFRSGVATGTGSNTSDALEITF